MQREPNPYAQQPAYTVTQTMAISVPSTVAEDVLDGEDMGGGESNIDSSTLVALQSDMVELKSDVADLSSQLNTVNDDVQQLTSQCIELKETTVAADYKGNAKSDLTLTINGSNGSLYLSAKDANNSITQLDRYALQVTLADLYDEDARYAFVNGVLSKSTNEGVSWDPISSSSSGSNNQVLSINGLDALSFSCNYDTRGTIIVQGSTTDASGLAYYPLATSSFANADSIACQMKPVSNGIAYSNDYGNTWTTITATSGSGSGSDSGSDSGSSSNIELKDPLSSLQVTGLSDYTLLLQAAYKDDPSTLGYCTLAVKGIANFDNPTCQLRVTSSGDIQTTTDGGSTWNPLGGYMELPAISLSDNSLNELMIAGMYTTGDQDVLAMRACGGSNTSLLSYYSLAAPAVFFIDDPDGNPKYAMRPTVHGVEWSNDAGQTWKVISPSDSSSGDSSSPIEGLTLVTTTAVEHNDALNLYKADEYEVVRFTNGVNSTNLDYHLQTTLCAVGIHETPFKDIDVATRTRLALVEGVMQASQPKLKYTYDGGDTWYDFNFQLDDSTGNLEIGDYTISVSNMAWLSDNASNLAALLNS